MLNILIQEKIMKLKLSVAQNDENISKIINSVSSDLEIISMMNYTIEF